MKKSGSIVVTIMDIMSEDSFLSGDQLIMSILKKKGAPVRGVFFLELIEGYKWIVENNYNGDVKYVWEVI